MNKKQDRESRMKKMYPQKQDFPEVQDYVKKNTPEDEGDKDE